MNLKLIKKGRIYPYFPTQTPQDIKNLLTFWQRGAVVCLLSPRSPKAEIKKTLSKLPARLKNAATIMFTSASSGNPKAVVHSLLNHYYNALGSNINLPLKPGDRWLITLPLYHVSGLSIVWRCLISGASIVFPEKSENLLDSIKNHGITHVSLVTTQLQKLLEDKKNIMQLSTLKAILLGGGPIPKELLKAAKNLPVFPTYGLTEMGSQVATAKKPGGPLYPLKYRKLKIIDGEVVVAGKTLFSGYLKNKELQKPGYWFYTGDLGSFDRKKGLKILGRKDNMFISGGENIYPEEIETALLNTKVVSQAVVIKVSHKKFGARPVAFIKPFGNLTKINNTLKKTLPSFKIPDTYYPFPSDYQQKGIKPDRIFLRKSLDSF